MPTVTVRDAGRAVASCVGRLRRGAQDPTTTWVAGSWWRATRTPAGPGVACYRADGLDALVEAWGPGADWLLEHAPVLLGDADDPAGFEPQHPLLARLWRENPWLRVGATQNIIEELAPAVIEQRVTGAEAFRSFADLTRRFGEPTPTQWPSPPLVLPLSADQWREIPSWDYLKAGVERQRARTLVNAAARNPNRLLDHPHPDAALQSLPGIGPWTSAMIRQTAFGDPDAWSVGDYHVPRAIALALSGDAEADPEELLAPYVGHRYRVQQLVALSGIKPERHGPRRSLPTHLPTRSGRGAARRT